MTMRRFLDRYLVGRSDFVPLYAIPEYVLGRIKGEALALHASRPNNSWLRDQATIVIGYVEAYGFYRPDEYPWGHVVEILSKMRRIIARAERLAGNINSRMAA